jgi:hypothetical protein
LNINELKSTLRAIILDSFCLKSFRARYSFSTAKKNIQTKWSGTILNICKMARRAKYKDVLCKMPLAAKVFNRKKWLVLGVKLDSLEARLRPVEHLDKDVEIGCGSSWTCE